MSELETQIQNRRAKRERLCEEGVAAYPERFEYDLEPSQVIARYGERDAAALEAEEIRLRVPGRLRSFRRHGKVAFADLWDGEAKLQLMVRLPQLGDEARFLVEQLDLGDYVGAEGRLIRTRTGELTLEADGLTMLAKALRPLPEKWHGLSDVEARYRQRYLDLMANPETRRTFEIRARLIAALRRELDARGFLEVETPMLQILAGGAAARPFVTRHNALDIDVYLRVAPELYLKRLLVGGLHRVYEINRNFRNEGISTQHNPEFTMLELYWAYADYGRMMELTEELLTGLAAELLDDTGLSFQGERIDLARPWRRLTVREGVREYAGLSAEEADDPGALAAALERRGEPLPQLRDYGNLLMALFEAVAERHLVQPTFVLEYPIEVSPLAKPVPGDPRFTERFELYIAGMECANGFSELNDPDVQAERFRAQLAARQQGDEEAHRFDADYVRALEYGMPPAGGEGFGIDRMVMLFADQPSIRDVILFPLMRQVEM
ncbi:MAG: lysine--tRNA ligase [Thermoanaerobaculia bacterium]